MTGDRAPLCGHAWVYQSGDQTVFQQAFLGQELAVLQNAVSRVQTNTSAVPASTSTTVAVIPVSGGGDGHGGPQSVHQLAISRPAPGIPLDGSVIFNPLFEAGRTCSSFRCEEEIGVDRESNPFLDRHMDKSDENPLPEHIPLINISMSGAGDER